MRLETRLFKSWNSRTAYVNRPFDGWPSTKTPLADLLDYRMLLSDTTTSLLWRLACCWLYIRKGVNWLILLIKIQMKIKKHIIPDKDEKDINYSQCLESRSSYPRKGLRIWNNLESPIIGCVLRNAVSYLIKTSSPYEPRNWIINAANYPPLSVNEWLTK